MSRHYHTHIEPDIQAQARTCDQPGCNARGCYPAPRQRHHLLDYYWFCLDHIREYNKKWDYFAGMDENEIEGSRRQDMVWERPSWPMVNKESAGRLHFGRLPFQDDGRDPYGSFAKAVQMPSAPASEPAGRWFIAGSAEEKALQTLEIGQPLTLGDLKKAYKTLVKKFHPDRHKGCKSAEDKLKSVIESYTLLKKAFQQ